MKTEVRKAIPQSLTKSELSPKLLIGIDPGVNTGFAYYDKENKKLLIVGCGKIHAILNWFYCRTYLFEDLFIRVEDARQRKWFGKAGREQLQGAGSIKRDCKIWEDFLISMELNFEMVAPKNNKTKLDAKAFKKITGWDKPTNEHSRDAAMLCFGF